MARESGGQPKRLYLRVPDKTGELYCKAKNLTEIFDGAFPLAFYDSSAKQYDFDHPGVMLNDTLLRELTDLLGKENVILK